MYIYCLSKTLTITDNTIPYVLYLIQRGQMCFHVFSVHFDTTAYSSSPKSQTVYDLVFGYMSVDVPGRNKGDMRRQRPTQDCWHDSQGWG